MAAYNEIRIQIPGFTIALKVWNERNAKPILCLHGKLDNAASFDLLAPYLPELHIIAQTGEHPFLTAIWIVRVRILIPLIPVTVPIVPYIHLVTAALPDRIFFLLEQHRDRLIGILHHSSRCAYNGLQYTVHQTDYHWEQHHGQP